MVNDEPNSSRIEVVADLSELTEAGRRFKTFYADPPWSYTNRATRNGAHWRYPTMSTGDIAALPVQQLADDNAHCHLWTTATHIDEAMSVLRAWGFDYKSMLVWIKPGRPGMGNYWRMSHEILLLGIRGKLPFHDHGQRSWVEEPRLDHSQKPWVFRRIVEAVSPPPRLEMFGREAIDGWTVFGNDVAPTLPFSPPTKRNTAC